mmetsp:Transcript_23730/g.40595  ORF Transcript_23730/g.40595 Transcript_23730/m.40595 type:complete len:449 (+) Transcript_23730:3-1349(+)
MMDEMRDILGDDPQAFLQLMGQFPLPPADKLRALMKMLPHEHDAFELATTMVSSFSRRCWARRMFEVMAPMTIEEIDSQAAEGMEDPVQHAAFMTLPAQQRRRQWLISVLEGCQRVEAEEGGELIVGSDEEDDDDDDDDDDDEDGDEKEEEPQAEGTPGRTCAGAFAWVKLQIENEGLGLIMLERPYAPEAPPDSITRSSILAKKHLLLMSDTAERALQIYKRGVRMQSGWMGGGTSLGNALWSRIFLPSATAAAEYLDERRTMPSHALGELLGILLLGRSDDGWLLDQEIYCEYDEFAHFFDSLGDSWKQVLSRPDCVTGLEAPSNAGPDATRTEGAPPRGYYRTTLLEMLHTWEAEVNDNLETFDEFAEESVARLTIEVDERLLKARTEFAYGLPRSVPTTHDRPAVAEGATANGGSSSTASSVTFSKRKHKRQMPDESTEATYDY